MPLLRRLAFKDALHYPGTRVDEMDSWQNIMEPDNIGTNGVDFI